MIQLQKTVTLCNTMFAAKYFLEGAVQEEYSEVVNRDHSMENQF